MSTDLKASCKQVTVEYRNFEDECHGKSVTRHISHPSKSKQDHIGRQGVFDWAALLCVGV